MTTLHAEGHRAPMNILVADDDEDVRALVVETLRADGHTVVEACDGAELVECLRDALDNSAACPDVIVTDVRMPKLSGLGVLAELRRSHWNVPVVLITVLADDSVRTVARRLGAVGVLKKPLDVDNLRTAVLNAGVAFARSRETTRQT
ncbi:MAG: response regulator [Polyangiaceae bacterium]|jgi:CheY-like chemotaxis protein